MHGYNEYHSNALPHRVILQKTSDTGMVSWGTTAHFLLNLAYLGSLLVKNAMFKQDDTAFPACVHYGYIHIHIDFL